MAADTTPHLPQPAPVEAYGRGGFRFGGMSHRGSILCLPDGIWGWPVTRVEDLDQSAFARVFAQAKDVPHFLLGTGDAGWAMPEPLRWRFRDAGINVEIMRTMLAANTYNILLGEGRRVGAGLIAVG